MSEAKCSTPPAVKVMYVEQPEFHVVHAIAIGNEEWSLRGLFTDVADAQKMVDALNQSADFIPGSAVLERLTMQQVIDDLVKQRIGEIAVGLAGLTEAIKGLLER